MSSDLRVFDVIGLGGRRTHASSLPDGSTALIAEIKPNEFIGAWTRARQLVKETGRWPVVSWTPRWEDFTSDEVFDRDQFMYSDRGSELTGDTSVSGLITRAAEMDLDALLATLESRDAWHREHLDDTVADALAKVTERWGTSPSKADIHHAATNAAHVELGVQRYLLEWELSQGAAPTKVSGGMTLAEQLEWTKGYLEPLEPVEPAALILLPTAKPWEVYAYLEGLWNHPSDRLIAAAHRWYDRYGAECMAILPGYATELQVKRPPADISQAWELAREHYLLAYDTFILPGIEVRDYARALMESPSWLLNSKP